MEDLLLKLLGPGIVFLATLLVNLTKKNIPAWVVTTFLVPLLSAAQQLVAGWLGTVPDFWTHFLLNLVSVFFYEFLKNITTAVRSVLLGPKT